MFEEINKFKIKVINLRKQVVFYVPNIISIGPLNDLFVATEWLVNEAMNDYEVTNKNVDERRKKNGYSPKNLDEIDKLSIRLGSRTQGYVNQLCLMEDILTYEYERMSKLVEEASSNKISLKPEEDYKHLKQRFNSIRIFRNKVVAHTAYTYPKVDRKTGVVEDNPETVVCSILNLFPMPAHITMGNSTFSGFSGYKSQLPVITIFNWEQEIKPIFEDWRKLFIEKLKEIHAQCPFNSKKFCIEIGSTHSIIRANK